MLQKTLKQGLGNWVDGDKFFDREKEMDLFRGYLRDRTSLLLVAPRRIGKTSFMREASRQLANDIIALHVDLQKAITPEEAIVELGLACRPHSSLWSKAASAFGNLVGKVESVKVSELSVTLRSSLNGNNWRQKGDELLNLLSAAAEHAKLPVVIFFDEVPILVSRILRGTDGQSADRKLLVDNFMSWMRDNVLRHKGHVVFVVTGSIGLEPVLRSAGLSGTLNAYHAFELGPWKEDIAHACLLALAQEKGLPLPAEVAAHMVESLGCAIPHHVQMFFDHVYSAYVVEEKAGNVTKDFVDAVYKKTMTGLRGHADLVHLEERLNLVLSDGRFTLALTLLTEAAVIGRLTPKASMAIVSQLKNTREDLLETLAILQHDGYLEREGDDLVYVSKLARDWWKNRFGHAYLPAA